jgi:predicted phosphodiesterase
MCRKPVGDGAMRTITLTPDSVVGAVSYALISDIHGNLPALERVLDELAALGVDDGLVLGDVAQGGDEPGAVLDRLAELGWPVILGNADAWLLDASVEEASEAERARREWSVSQLEERHRRQIGAFHPTYERDGLLAFHGSPRGYDDILFPNTEDRAPWQVGGYAFLAGGHTHFQWTTRVGDAVYVNPGSVGAAIHRWNDRRLVPGRAEYAIVHDSGVEFRHCAY